VCVCVCVCVRMCVCVCVFWGQFFGDMAILGEKDWAESTCFNFLPQDTKEHTEIMATPLDYVVTIKLTAEKFQIVYDAASAITKVQIFSIMILISGTKVSQLTQLAPSPRLPFKNFLENGRRIAGRFWKI
jgi:hypothetical protein